MKKIILVLFVSLISLSAFLFFPSPKLQAQTPTNRPFDFTVPGTNCGFAEDPLQSRCCRVSFPSSFIPPDVGPLNAIVNTFSFFTNFARDNFLQPIIDAYTSMTKGNISSCYTGVQSIADANDPSCKCINPVTPSPGYLKAMNDFCQRQANLKDRNACISCSNDGGVFSGIGCVKTDSGNHQVKWLIKDIIMSNFENVKVYRSLVMSSVGSDPRRGSDPIYLDTE